MKKAFRIILIVVVVLAIIAASGILFVRYTFPKVDKAPAITLNRTTDQVKRGEYLANHVAVCIDCHSTRDWSRFSAPPIAGTAGKGGDMFDHSMGFPGVLYAKNITSDKETGLGNWTDGEIYRAITSGVSRDGEPLFPLMPYMAYNQMAEDDLHAIIAYVRTLAPVKNSVKQSQIDFPVNLIMRTMPGKHTPVSKPALNDSVATGKYLFTIAGCTGCHTPEGDAEGKFLAGGAEFKFPSGATLRSANITPDKETGIGNWTEQAFVQRFKSAAKPEATAQKLTPDAFNTVMPWSMYGGMAEEDLRAIYKYLRSVEPVKNKVEKFTPAPKSIAKK
ncbi:c-type cytochrome [Pontibacter ruber]|uniref:C-type cytochrome n=1 Tax=Pontibacter ruber TaxID=1343895 RepID=A0ABW5CTR1_9BACT|nr:c-type cytochrome [Pontibacter ruber]